MGVFALLDELFPEVGDLLFALGEVIVRFALLVVLLVFSLRFII